MAELDALARAVARIDWTGMAKAMRRIGAQFSRMNQIQRARSSRPSKLSINGHELSRRRRSRCSRRS